MSTNLTTPKGKRAFAGESLPCKTRRVVNDLDARIEQLNGRGESGELPVIDAEEWQMAGFFIIAQPRRKKL
jgi:hypothetical protein